LSNSKVDFFFIGFPKSGSTTFYYLLKEHPDIFAPEIKEPKFFCTDINRQLKNNLGKNYFQLINSEDEYAYLFNNADNKIKGDFNPFNIFSEDAPRNILKYNPHAKILISIREPVSFLRSFHFQSLYRLIEDEPDFLKALSLEKNRRANKNIPKYCNYPFFLYYSSLIDYKKYISRFFDAFPLENIKIFLFDDIVKNEIGIYKDILHFLNVKNLDYEPTKPDRNPSHALRFAWLRKVLFTPSIQKWLHTVIPLRLMPVGAKVSKMIFKKNQKKPFVSNEDIKLLKTQYKSAVYELEDFLTKENLLDRDLIDTWGYSQI
jgi:hypothetical protein